MQEVQSIMNQPSLSRIGVIRLGVKDARGRSQEVGHFIFDIEDSELREKAFSFYGQKPTTLDITFFSDVIDDIFRCTLQRWGKSKTGTPYLVCEGDGNTAISEGAKRPCPCSAIETKECRKTTVLKFLIPGISIGGYFRLATKSKHSAPDIQTALRLVRETTRGLIMRPFKLRRTEGYAKINGIKMKKYFVSLECHGALPAAVLDSKEPVSHGAPVIRQCPPLLPPFTGDQFSISYRNEKRLRRGRRMVKEKIKLFIMNPHSESALENYAIQYFKKASFNDLTVEELLELWHDIEDKPETVGRIYELTEEIMRQKSL